MGIGITYHKDNGWNITLNEEWELDTIQEAESLIAWLLGRIIPFSVSYSFELVHIKFTDVKLGFKEFEKFKMTLDEILKFKKDFGEIKNFKPKDFYIVQVRKCHKHQLQ